MTPGAARLMRVAEATWPPAASATVGPWCVREGRGGGKRVSAARAIGRVTEAGLPRAEAAMRALGQRPLFMIREGEARLDAMLAAQGHDLVAPVNILAAPVERLARDRPPRSGGFAIWEPLAIMHEIWAAGGIGPGRIAVMHRACGPKTGLLGRVGNRPAGTGFAAIHHGVAMVHALEVLHEHRRAGLGREMMQEAAHWAATHGATHVAALCTRSNTAANALYSSLGMTVAGRYHYRQDKGGHA